MYNTGIDDAIGRLSAIADAAGTASGMIEAYSYLGLSTVVKQDRPGEGVSLTYVKQSGESNGDAGDQYSGLDRFGRVVDQRWYNQNNATDTIGPRSSRRSCLPTNPWGGVAISGKGGSYALPARRSRSVWVGSDGMQRSCKPRREQAEGRRSERRLAQRAGRVGRSCGCQR